MRHVSVFNHELLNPIQKYGNSGKGKEAFQKLRLLTDRMMLRRLKKDHTNSMELPVKEINIDRQFFGEEENDFASSIMTSGQRKFDTYVAQGVLLNNYANIFGLLMQMRQVADHPDLILKRSSEGGQNIMVCCICDEPAEEAIRSKCKHDFCRTCAVTYVHSQEQPDCPHCHIPLSIDLEQQRLSKRRHLSRSHPSSTESRWRTGPRPLRLSCSCMTCIDCALTMRPISLSSSLNSPPCCSSSSGVFAEQASLRSCLMAA